MQELTRHAVYLISVSMRMCLIMQVFSYNVSGISLNKSCVIWFTPLLIAKSKYFLSENGLLHYSENVFTYPCKALYT